MPAPTTPTTDITLLGQVNGNAYNASTNPKGLAAGGHRQNWAPAMNAMANVATWVASDTAYLSALADQVAADAASAAAGSGTEASVANIRAGTSAQYLSVRNVYAANVGVALTDGATIAWNMASGINFTLTLGAAGRALANPTNQVAGKNGYLIVTQDGSGSRTITSYGSNFLWAGGEPTWPTTPGAQTVISYVVVAPGTIVLQAGGSTAQ